IQVESIEPATAEKLFEFVQAGGRIFFIEKYPVKSPGWKNYPKRDMEVREWLEKIKSFKDRSTFIKKPGIDHVSWFKSIQQEHKLVPYIEIDRPNKFVS